MRALTSAIAFALAALAPSSLAVIPPTERDALVALYDATTGPEWVVNANWRGDPGTECTWYGVTCNESSTSVIRLDLGWNNLNGPIPSQIRNLTNLQALVIMANPLTGSFSDAVFDLVNLRELVAGQYYGRPFGGAFPVRVTNLTHLEHLDLSGNDFTGSIPPGLAMLPLRELDLGANRLTGTIPPGIFQISTLESLSLWYNELGGTLPQVDLPALEWLDLSGNQFSGPIPATLQGSPHLKALYLPSNELTGAIPSELGRLVELEELDLHANDLTGPIPPELGNMVSLKSLQLHQNFLTGTIPPALGQLRNLRTLSLSYLRLTGTIPAEILALDELEHLWVIGREGEQSLTGKLEDFLVLTSLRTLYVSNNEFTGPIPEEIAVLSELTDLHIGNNPIGGEIPTELGDLVNLRDLNLAGAGLSGAVPGSIAALPELRYLRLERNQLTSVPDLGALDKLLSLDVSDNELDSFPAGISGMTSLEFLGLSRNRIEGVIPPEILSLPNLVTLWLGENLLTGSIPPLRDAKKLENLSLGLNQLTGPIPDDIGEASSLWGVDVYSNRLSGPIPAAIGNLASLYRLALGDNELSGQIPDLSGLVGLRYLYLSRNHLEGRIPPTLGALSNLIALDLGANRLAGPVPAELGGLHDLRELGLSYNGLYNRDPALAGFLSQTAGSNWESTQTVAPSDAAIAVVRDRSIVLSWTPIAYTWNPGGYQVQVASAPSGPFSVLVTTPDKTTTTFVLDGLSPSTDYYVRLAAVTYSNHSNPNTVLSEPTTTLPARTTDGTPAPASVVVLSYTDGMYQFAGESGAYDRYIVANLGDVPTTLTVGQEGDFFTTSPTTFVLVSGGSQEIRLDALARPAGTYAGTSIPSGDGVPAGLRIPVRLLSTEPPTGEVNAVADTNRIDVAAVASETELGGSVVFTNTGTATLTGIVVADQPWIIPPTDLITIEPSHSVTVEFTIDRTQRPDAADLGGTVIGTLSLVYASGTNAAAAVIAYLNPDNPRPANGTTVTTTLVTVIDTVKPPVSTSGFPALRPGEVPLFIAGAGHAQGTVGLFLSDLSMINVYGTDAISDVAIYYTPTLGVPRPTGVSASAPIQPGQALVLADVIKNVFDGSAEQGTLQIRSLGWNQLALNANIINVSSPRGTYGTSIPVLRGDRAAAPGATLALTGLRRDPSSHTNILLQEVSGVDAVVDIAFHASDGSIIPSPPASIGASVPAFRLARLNDIVPSGAVLALVTNRPDSGGRIAAYATPVDDLSGDTWAIADWNLQFASSRTEPHIIPVAGSVRGANNNFFRTDVALTNSGTTPASVTLRYHFDNGVSRADRTIALTPKQTRIYDDVIGNVFPELVGRLGFISVIPISGEILATSRTFATQDGVDGTFGTSVPTLPRSFALHAGQKRIIAGLQVASARTINARTPATFRTNLFLVETEGRAATVQVTVVYAEVGKLAYGTRLLSRTFELAPYDLQVANVTNLIAAVNPSVGDLRNVQVEIRVTGGEGGVIPLTSSIDNGTADQTLRIE